MPERIWFGRTDGFYPGLTRLLNFSQWDQVGIELYPDILYRVTREDGVQRTTLDKFRKETSLTASIDVDLDNTNRAKVFLERQIGKKYNYFSDFYLPDLSLDNHPRWAPSELAYYALNVGQLNDTLRYDNMTPNELWVDLHLVKTGVYR